MTELYTGNEYNTELGRKKRMITVYLIILLIYIIISTAIIISFAILPYGTKNTVFIVGDIAISTIFWGYSFFFFSNKYNRIRKYVKMLGFIQTGLRETYEGNFLRFDDTLEVKDVVDFYTMITKEWNERKQEFFERKVLIDCEKAKPEISIGSRVRYVTQGNILVTFKILINTAEGK